MRSGMEPNFRRDVQHRCCAWPRAMPLLPVMAAFLLGNPDWRPTPAYALSEAVPEGAEVVIQIVNGTDRQPATAEKVVVLPADAVGRPVAEALAVEGQVNLGPLALRPNAQYVVEAISSGVSYFAQATGRQLWTAPTTVYVFSPTTNLDGVRASGMNLVIRRAETELILEYLLTVVNEGTPQQTVIADPVSLEMILPPNASLDQTECLRGPTPLPFGTEAGTDPAWTGLAVALTPGTNRLRLTAKVPYPDGLTLPVGFNIPVTEWSVLTFPADMEIRGEDLEPAAVDTEGDFQRHRGPALAAGATIAITLGGGSGPVITGVEVSSTPTTDQVLAQQDSNGGGGLLKYWWAIILMAIAVFVVLRRSKP